MLNKQDIGAMFLYACCIKSFDCGGCNEETIYNHPFSSVQTHVTFNCYHS